MIRLRDESWIKDRRLDRMVQFDGRSRGFGIRSLVDARPFRGYTWECLLWLDQGREGACVGNGLTLDLAARPAVVRSFGRPPQEFATKLYYMAQWNDQWDGGEYPGAVPHYGGTSTLAGIKALHKLGWTESYRWGFGLDDLRKGVAYNGPACIGINWYEGMYYPDSKGVIRVEGDIAGGHLIMVRGVSERDRMFRLRNSWGLGYGINGDCWLSFDDTERLLHEDGEAVFMVGRKLTGGLPVWG